MLLQLKTAKMLNVEKFSEEEMVIMSFNKRDVGRTFAQLGSLMNLLG